MKSIRSRVDLSTYSAIVTLLIFGVLTGCMLLAWKQSAVYGVIGAVIVVVLLTAAMIYAPISVSIDDRNVLIHSPLRISSIPFSNIISIERFQPTMGARRILGSGGFMGYWGIFREADVGRYTAFYGKASDCFMLTLRDGRKYVIGCKDPEKIIAGISSRIL